MGSDWVHRKKAQGGGSIGNEICTRGGRDKTDLESEGLGDGENGGKALAEGGLTVVDVT